MSLCSVISELYYILCPRYLILLFLHLYNVGVRRSSRQLLSKPANDLAINLGTDCVMAVFQHLAVVSATTRHVVFSKANILRTAHAPTKSFAAFAHLSANSSPGYTSMGWGQHIPKDTINTVNRPPDWRNSSNDSCSQIFI